MLIKEHFKDIIKVTLKPNIIKKEDLFEGLKVIIDRQRLQRINRDG